MVQRIPVKIVLDAGSPLADALRPGHVGLSDDRHHARRRTDPAPRSRARTERREALLFVEGGGSCRASLKPLRSPFRGFIAPPVADRASLTSWIAVLASMIGAFMAILNIQITNASLLDIEGGIGTGVDNGAWISTSYLIGEIVVIPLTDYLSRVFSFRRYMLANAILFPLFSIACAFAHDLGSMIVMRGLQGFAGGILIPMAFTMVLTKLPKAQQPIGLALFALAVTFAPAIGPTIGGYLTENYGWQTIFFVNTAPSAVMVVGARLDAGARADAALAPEGRRLGRHRHHGDRSLGAADRARGGQQGRLVRLAVHLPAGDRRRGLPYRLHRDRTDG